MLCAKDKSIEGFAEYVCCFVTSNYTAGISQQASECQTEVFIDCYLFLLTYTQRKRTYSAASLGPSDSEMQNFHLAAASMNIKVTVIFSAIQLL